MDQLPEYDWKRAALDVIEVLEQIVPQAAPQETTAALKSLRDRVERSSSGSLQNQLSAEIDGLVERTPEWKSALERHFAVQVPAMLIKAEKAIRIAQDFLDAHPVQQQEGEIKSGEKAALPGSKLMDGPASKGK